MIGTQDTRSEMRWRRRFEVAVLPGAGTIEARVFEIGVNGGIPDSPVAVVREMAL